MKTNGFSREKYNHLIIITLVFTIGICLIWTFVLLLASYYHGGNALSEEARIVSGVVLSLFCLSATTYILAMILGRFFFKRYATQVIDHEDGPDILRVRVTPSHIKVIYEEYGEVKTACVKYSDYGIKVRVRRDFENPIFYYGGMFIYEVVIPYTTAKDPYWTKYEIE